jgi:predicted GIY-YIG superfamily endonuclease
MILTVTGSSGKNYSFEGIYSDTSPLKDMAGVYLIIVKKNDKYYPIDIGEAKEVKTRIENHDRKDCWKKHCPINDLFYAPYYIEHGGKTSRVKVEQDIREYYNFPCGNK